MISFHLTIYLQTIYGYIVSSVVRMYIFSELTVYLFHYKNERRFDQCIIHSQVKSDFNGMSSPWGHGSTD